MEIDEYLVAGLGNPGDKYARTRHNVGFMVAGHLAKRFGLPLEKKKFDVEYNIGEMANKKIFLARPMTFMNNSGHALFQLARYFKLESQKMLIIHDDIDLTFGKIKIKTKGGHGGHKGVEDIINAFGDNVFTRIRIGVGHPGDKDDVVGHVLGNFSTEEISVLDQLIQRAGDAAETILRKNEKEAMRIFHGEWESMADANEKQNKS